MHAGRPSTTQFRGPVMLARPFAPRQACVRMSLGSDATPGSDDPLRVASPAPTFVSIFADGFESPPGG